jgi:hypothetical protein
MGFLEAVDGQPRQEPAHPGPSLPWLRPALKTTKLTGPQNG